VALTLQACDNTAARALAPHAEFSNGVEGTSGRRGNGESVGVEGANVGVGGRCKARPRACSRLRA
jgi:hypothetical protein